MNWTRRQLLASGMAAGLTACSGGAPRNKAGGPPPPVTVTLGNPDPSGVLPDTQDITYFARQVHQLSGGQMNIRILWLVTQADNSEQATAALVKDGRVDLGWIGARAWDTLGVRSFQALQAPFLIDSYPLLDAVLRSPMASDMLAGLDQAGFAGLGLYPGQLRHPAGFRKPFVSLRDFRGARIRVPASRASDALYRALGAVPEHLGSTTFAPAVASGSVDGVDASAALAATVGGRVPDRQHHLLPQDGHAVRRRQPLRQVHLGPAAGAAIGGAAHARVRAGNATRAGRRHAVLRRRRQGGDGQRAGRRRDRAGGPAGLRLPRAGPAGEGVHPADPADEAAVPGPGPGGRLLIPGSPFWLI